MTLLHVICGLAPPPQSKILATPMTQVVVFSLFFNCFQQLAVIGFWLTYAVYHMLSSIKNSNIIAKYSAEVESSRTSLASRTDFEVLGLGLGLEGQVLGLGLEASSPRKLACPRLEDSTIFWKVKILWSSWKFFGKRFFVEIAWKIFVKTFFFFFGDRLKNFCEDLFFFFFLSTCASCPWSLALASSIPVLGLESVCPRKGCPWPWPRIFFVSLALASSLVSSTPPLVLRHIL